MVFLCDILSTTGLSKFRKMGSGNMMAKLNVRGGACVVGISFLLCLQAQSAFAQAAQEPAAPTPPPAAQDSAQPETPSKETSPESTGSETSPGEEDTLQTPPAGTDATAAPSEGSPSTPLEAESAQAQGEESPGEEATLPKEQGATALVVAPQQESTSSSELSVEESSEAAPLQLELPQPPSPFSQGRIRVGLGIGMATSSSNDWLLLGLGAGYYVFDGLEPHLDTTFYLFGDPFIATVTPGLRYVLHMVPRIKPYVGAFYRHYFVATELPDTNSIGARLGLYFMTGGMSYFGGGAVYEHYTDENYFAKGDQDVWYPEITFSLSF